MSHFLNQLLPYLPYITFIAFAIGIILVVVLGMLATRYLQKRVRAKTLTRMPDEPAVPFHQHPLYLKVKEWVRRGVDGAKNRLAKPGSDDLTAAFGDARHVMKTYFGHDAPYDLPWFLVLGSAGSGKTTLLQDVDLERPIGQPESDHQTYLRWSYFDRGIALDVSGQLFLESKDNTADDRNWDYFCRLLSNARPRRPLDGVLLTISASELLSPPADPGNPLENQVRYINSTIKDRAQKIADQLNHLQKITGMRVPVYVVITKCDLLPGFQGFSSALPLGNRQEMLGWSCPYGIESSYQQDWVDSIVYGIHRALDRVRLAIFATRRQDKEGRDIFLFPRAFLTIREKLSLYLDGIFKDTPYHESFFLRGVYLAGRDGDIASDQVPNLGLSVSQSPWLTAGTSQENHDRMTGRGTILFLKDLFDQKIFREASLGQPAARILSAGHKVLTMAKGAAVSMAVIWVLGLIHGQMKLADNLRTIEPVLNEIHKGIQGLIDRGGLSDDPKTLAYLNHEAARILELFTGVNSVNTASFFMPTSWVSTLDDRIRLSMTAAYDRIILPSLYTGLKNKAASVFSMNRGGRKGSKSSDDPLAIVNPTALPSFDDLKTYVMDLNDLEHGVDLYNNLENSTSVEDLGELIKYIYNKNLPDQFYSQADYYKKALAKTSDRPFDLSDYRGDAGQKLGFLFRLFLQDGLDAHRSLAVLDNLKQKLNGLGHPHTVKRLHGKDLRAIAAESVAAADILSSGALSWIDGETFDPSPAYGDFLAAVNKSNLLGTEIGLELVNVADRAFQQFQKVLPTFKSDLTGTFLTIVDGRLVAEPSPGLVSFIDALTAFLEEPFMAPPQGGLLTLKVPPSKLLFWDDGALNTAASFIDGYEGYVQERLPQLPQSLQSVFRVLGRNGVRDQVTSALAAAQTFHDIPQTTMASFGMRDMVGAQVQNLNVAMPFFAKILGVFGDGAYVEQNSQLRGLLVEQTYHLLERIDGLLSFDNLYASRDDAFLWWDGSPMLGLKAFAVHDISDMKTYLKAQRYRVSFLAKELAEPVLSLLSLGYLENTPYDLPLALKWTRIVGALDQYETQSPGNSLRQLEQFLTYDLNEISADNCLTFDMNPASFGDHDTFDGASDYFSDIQETIEKAVKRRCAVIASQGSVDRYNKAATFFNVNLAGRFPFTKTPGVERGLEADPSDVVTFFKLYDQLTEQDIKVLKKASSFVGAGSSIERFIRDAESARPFLLASLDGDMDKAVSHLDLDVAFRTDQDLEQGGDQIIDWSMAVGGDRRRFRDGNTSPFVWRVGTPILLDFKWALDGDYVPAGDGNISNLIVDGLRASFLYEGRWSLIQLIRRHAAAPSVFNGAPGGPQPIVVEFKVPTYYSPECLAKKDGMAPSAPAGEARLYLRLGVHSVRPSDQSGKKPLSAADARYLAVPSFPIEAPVLEQVNLRLP